MACDTSIINVFIGVLAWSSVLVFFFENRLQGQEADLQGDVTNLQREVVNLKRCQVDVVNVQAEVAKLQVEVDTLKSSQVEVAYLQGQVKKLQASQASQDEVNTSLKSEQAEQNHQLSVKSQSGRLNVPRRLSGRRLTGFYNIGGTGSATNEHGPGVGCTPFGLTAAGAFDVNVLQCRGTTNTEELCTGCFINQATDADRVLTIGKCSTARWKVDETMANHKIAEVMMLEFINTAPSNIMTIKSCTDKTCSANSGTPVTSFILPAMTSAVAYCYSGGGDRMYFTHTIGSVVANGDNFNFQGKTITNLGTVTTAKIDAGTIAAVTITNSHITVPSGKTLNVGAGSLVLSAGQVTAASITGGTFDDANAFSFAGSTITTLGTVQGGAVTLDSLNLASGTITLAAAGLPATMIKGGQFSTGTAYNFQGATITNLGTVTTAVINGGTITGTTITVPSGNTLDVSAGTLTLAAAQLPATMIKGGTFSTATAYSFAGSAMDNLGNVGSCTVTASSASVTCDGQHGTIQTQAGSYLASGGSSDLTVTNNKLLVGDTFVALISKSCGTGEVIVRQVVVTNNQAVITFTNIHASQSCNARHKVSFIVMHIVPTR